MKKKSVKQNQSGNSRGFILLPRSFLDHPFWFDRRKLSKAEAFLDLLFMARYGKEPSRIFYSGEEITVEYGMIITSILRLSAKWKRSDRWVKRVLSILQKDGIILLKIIRNRRIELKILYDSSFFIKSGIQNTGKSRTDFGTEAEQKQNRSRHKNKDNIINKGKEITLSCDNGFTGGNPDINFLIDYLKSKLGLPLLDESVRTNRHYCWLAFKKFGGRDKVQLLIDVTAQHSFWKNRITSFKQLYYKGVQIISSTRGGETYGQYRTR